MAKPAAPARYRGLCGSGTIATGPIALLRPPAAPARQPGSTASETAVLKDALAFAKTGLEQLIAGTGAVAGEILEFQVALIEDEDLMAPVIERIASGTPADIAFAAVMDGEIAEYRAGGDDYLAARADDLADLKQRVLTAMAAPGSAHAIQPANRYPAGAIIVADEMLPSVFLELDLAHLSGIAVTSGSPSGHVAILARARNVNLVVALKADLPDFADGTPAILDAQNGELILNPSDAMRTDANTKISTARAELTAARHQAAKPASTADGEPVTVYMNVDDPALLSGLDPVICDGIGLTRTEFLFTGKALPGEHRQYETYSEIVRWAQGRPVTLRTLDAGGDKPLAGVSAPGEANPFLGMRGIRLMLQHEDMLITQLRAMARAAALGPVKIMVPMVTVPGELTTVRHLLQRVLHDLAARAIEHAAPQLGMMVEVPAAALTAATFDADFYSIGSNDLIQYTCAAARDNAALTSLAAPDNPAVLELIARTVAAAGERGVEVSLCGDMASRPEDIAALLRTGLRALSAGPARIGAVKRAIAGFSARKETA